MKAIDYLPEQLKTVKNLCDISLLLLEQERGELLPTVLELLYEEAQSLIDEFCVVPAQTMPFNKFLEQM